MQTKRIYQVQHWLNGQWSREHNWCKVEAFSEKEAAEKVCGVALTEAGKLAQLRARVLTLGNLKQRSATSFYDHPPSPTSVSVLYGAPQLTRQNEARRGDIAASGGKRISSAVLAPV